MARSPSGRISWVLGMLAAACSGSSGDGGAAAPAPRAAAANPGPAAAPAGTVIPRFTDVTGPSGVAFTSLPRPEYVGYGQGAAVADVDGDGDLDIFLTQDRGPCALYRNDGGLRFTEVAAAAGVQVSTKEAHAKSAAFFDYDRDGHPDLFVGTTGEGNHLFRNRGDGTFEEVTAAAGIGGGKGYTLSAVPGDFNNDGWPDLFEANCPPVDYVKTFTSTGVPAPDRLWRNNRDGTFTDVAPELGVADPLASWSALWFDLDGDGNQDLLVANDHFFYQPKPTRDRAYMNLGAAAGFAFKDRAAEFGMDENHSGMGFAVGDIDGDGTFDIYTPDYGPNELRLGSDPPPRSDRAAALGVADGDAGSLLPAISWGCAILDLDRDGWNDLLVFRGSLASADPGGVGAARQVPCLWLSRPAGKEGAPGAPSGGRIFVESAKEAGLAGLGCPGARAAIPCDLDGDGDLDLVVSMRFGNARILRNDTPSRGPWYGVRLRGSRSPREGFGAVLELAAGPRTVRQHCSSGGQTGATFPPEWILAPGPGASAKARLTVRWPSGTVQEVEPARDSWTTVEEPR
jgi:hypothetical protein